MLGNTLSEQLAIRIEKKLQGEEYGCLSAYLLDIKRRFAAEEIGVFSISGSELTLRQHSSGPSRLFDELQSELLTTIKRTSPSPQTTINDLTRWFYWKEKDLQVVLQRVWPDPTWYHSSDAAYWVYVVGCRTLPQTNYSPDPEWVQQLGHLTSAFIRWTNDIFRQREDFLGTTVSCPKTLLRTHRELVIRPMQPHRYYLILRQFSPIAENPPADHIEKRHQWCCFLDAFYDTCCRPEECECRMACGLSPDDKNLVCPQTHWIDRRLRILTQLEKWRTGVWKYRRDATKPVYHGKPTQLRSQVIGAGLDGLRDAAGVLLWTESESDNAAVVTFTEGHPNRSKERFLVKYFCARAIQMSLEKFESKWKDSQTRPAELELAARLGELASLLLGNGSWTAAAIENLIHVVALFGHEVLGIPERIDLVRHLNQTLRGETALHTLKRRYRDHFFHTLEVCFLGFLILTSHPSKPATGKKSRTFLDKLIAACKKHRKTIEANDDASTRYPRGLPQLPDTTEKFLAQWWTAALIHDTAYGIDIYGGTLKLLEFFGNHNAVSGFAKDSAKAVAELSAKLRDIAPELKDDNSILRAGDHGVIAAASLLDVLNHIGPRTTEIFLPAVRAIAFHNTRHPRVDAGVDPVAALLILCDTVQEWGRSSLGFTMSPAVIMSRIVEAASVPEEDQFGPVERYGISIQANTDAVSPGEMPSTFNWVEPRRLRIELDYSRRSVENCGAKFTWADMTYNFQRVDYRPWNIGIDVQVSVPIVPSGDDGHCGKTVKTQIEYFDEFVSDQRVLFVERWLKVAFANDATKAVRSWFGLRKGGDSNWSEVTLSEIKERISKYPGGLTDSLLREREIVSFNLPALSQMFCDETPLMGGTAADFGKAIESWSVFSREQADAPPVQRPPV